MSVFSRWKETVFRDTYRLYWKRSKTNFPSWQSNQFYTHVDQRVEVWNSGCCMAIAIVMHTNVMRKSSGTVCRDGLRHISIDFGNFSIFFFKIRACCWVKFYNLNLAVPELWCRQFYSRFNYLGMILFYGKSSKWSSVRWILFVYHRTNFQHVLSHCAKF